MQQLTFVGIHDDGEHLVLEDAPDGQRYQVRIDQPLRQAVARARRALQPRGLSGDGAFGPRDIQTRFRQGASVEEIVAESGWKAERVRKYEFPILAERAHMIRAAQAAPVHPSGSAAGSRPDREVTLHHQVVAVREDWGFAEGEATWNSWQREDGQWNVTISLDYSRSALEHLPEDTPFPARFVFNPANQSIAPVNAAAEFLLGEHQKTPSTEQPAPAASTTAVTDAASAEDTDSPDSSDPSESSSSRRGGHLRPVSEQESTAEDDLLEELERRRGAPTTEQQDAHLEELAEAYQRESDQDSRSDGEADETSARSRSKRPSVPSWDDIVFGNKH